MRTETRKLYTAEDLKAGGGEIEADAFDKALEHYREHLGNCAWSDEICESGRETVKAAGLRLENWSVDQSNVSGSYYEVSGFGEDEHGRDIGEYTGRAARGWITAAFLPKYKFNWRIKRNPGDCPFTGYRGDDDCIDAIRDAIKSGETLHEAFNGLGAVIAKQCASESEYEATEEYFLEHSGANDWEYDKNGDRI